MNNFVNTDNFPECCENVNEEKIFIKDIVNSQAILSDENNYHFVVVNKQKKDISFLKIDKCVFNDGDGKKCDFALADENHIFFIEVKGLEKFDDHLKKKNKRSEAKKQLIETIKFFKHKYPALDLKQVFAIVALYPVLDDSYIKIVTLKEQLVIDKFIDECGCPNISEGNYLEFK
jgi:hypothetical protein